MKLMRLFANKKRLHDLNAALTYLGGELISRDCDNEAALRGAITVILKSHLEKLQQIENEVHHLQDLVNATPVQEEELKELQGIRATLEEFAILILLDTDT